MCGNPTKADTSPKRKCAGGGAARHRRVAAEETRRRDAHDAGFGLPSDIAAVALTGVSGRRLGLGLRQHAHREGLHPEYRRPDAGSLDVRARNLLEP